MNLCDMNTIVGFSLQRNQVKVQSQRVHWSFPGVIVITGRDKTA